MRRAFLALLAVAFVVLSVLADSGARPVVLTGAVTQYRAGEWIAIANDQTGPVSVQIAVRETTVFESRAIRAADVPEAIGPGAVVTVWSRSVGERRAVADRVRLLKAAAPP